MSCGRVRVHIGPCQTTDILFVWFPLASFLSYLKNLPTHRTCQKGFPEAKTALGDLPRASDPEVGSWDPWGGVVRFICFEGVHFLFAFACFQPYACSLDLVVVFSVSVPFHVCCWRSGGSWRLFRDETGSRGWSF